MAERLGVLGTFLLSFALLVSACSSSDPDVTAPASSATASSSAAAARDEPVEPGELVDEGEHADEPGGPTLSATSAFEEGECLMVLPPGRPQGVVLTCGHVTVPSDPEDPMSDDFRLATVFVDNGGDDLPVVFLPGGPGAPGYSGGPLNFSGAPFNVIAFDERGVGFSEPTLDCPEVDALFSDIVTSPTETTVEPYGDALSSCYSRLSESGVDLTLFDSAKSALDIGAVHRALGFEEVILLGGSYGTRLALTKARDEPEGIHAMILDSVVPLDTNVAEAAGSNYRRAFDLLVSECDASPDCRANGNVAENAELLAQVLDEEPVVMTVPRPFGRGSVEFYVDGDQLWLSIYDSLFNSRTVQRVPQALASALTGGMRSLIPLLESSVAALDPSFNTSEGYHLSVLCREDWPFNDPSVVDLDQIGSPEIFASVFDTERDCAIWETTPSAAVENEAVITSIPTLVIAGAFDPVAPPSDSRRVAERLPNAVYVEFPAGGHTPGPTTGCGRSILESFIADPTSTPNLDCVAELPAPSWER